MATATRTVDVAQYFSTRVEASGGVASYGTVVPDATKYRRIELSSRDFGGTRPDIRTDREYLGSGGRRRTTFIDSWTGSHPTTMDATYDLLSIIVPVAGYEVKSPVVVAGATGAYDHYFGEWDFPNLGIQLASFSGIALGGDVDQARGGYIVREWSLRGQPRRATAEFTAQLEWNGKPQETADIAGLVTGSLPAFVPLRVYASAGMTMTVDGRDIILTERSIIDYQLTWRNTTLDEEAFPPGSPPIDATDPLSGPSRLRHETTTQLMEFRVRTRLNATSQFFDHFKARVGVPMLFKLTGPAISGASPTTKYEFEVSCPNLLFNTHQLVDANGVMAEESVFEAGDTTNIFSQAELDGSIGIRIRDGESGALMQKYAP